MKKLIFILSLVSFFYSCTSNNNKKIEYEVAGAVSKYKISYLNESGTLITEIIIPESTEDKWHYSFIGEEGDIVYISGKYDDINSALHILIKVNGKVYKEGYSKGDTLKYLTVSGVIPYE
jgi:hypothetical protein